MTGPTTGSSCKPSLDMPFMQARPCMSNSPVKIMLAAAFSTQIAGHAAGEHYALDLTDFERYRGNLKFEIEF